MIEKAVGFLKRFYKDELGITIENYVSQEYLNGFIHLINIEELIVHK